MPLTSTYDARPATESDSDFGGIPGVDWITLGSSGNARNANPFEQGGRFVHCCR